MTKMNVVAYLVHCVSAVTVVMEMDTGKAR